MHQLLMVDKSTLESTSELVRFALIHYCIMVRTIAHSDYPLVNPYVTLELAEWNAEMLTDAFTSHTELLLWIMVIFAVGIARPSRNLVNRSAPPASSPQGQSSRRGSKDAQDFDVSAFVAKVGRRACQALDVTDEAQLRDLLKTFLFDDDFMDEKYTTFVEEGLRLK